MEVYGLKRVSKIGYLQSHLAALYYEIMNKFVPSLCSGWTVGFSNRKLRLLLDFVPQYEQEEALERVLCWHQENRGVKRATIPPNSRRPKMG
ncbi:unnamed protein product [Gongylonema pulchrum]|uniref:Uncharacterized protein n=1 Tax=Gongylonema pulchrum TaxID=637853 RepID=A0A3P7MKK3_9BILA|nr:unnamed protein product [Gongylonema pulchrum]